MTSTIQAVWAPLDDYRAHIAQAVLDFSLDASYRVNFSNILYDGSVIVKPKYVTIDNLENASTVTLNMNGVEVKVLPFERMEKVLSGNPAYLDFSGAFGKTTVLISEAPFSTKANADNLYGSIFPSLKNFRQTIIAATVGYDQSHSVTLKKGEVVIWIVDGNNENFQLGINGLTASIPELEVFNYATWTGINPSQTQARFFGLPRDYIGVDVFTSMQDAVNCRSGAGQNRPIRMFAMRAIADVTFKISAPWPIGILVRYTSFIIQNCPSGDMLDVIADTKSKNGGGNPDIASIAAGTVYTMPSVNLSGLKRFALMVTSVTNATLASAEQIGAVALTERFDNNGVSNSTGWVDKAGTTDNPQFTHAAAAGQTLGYAIAFINGG